MPRFSPSQRRGLRVGAILTCAFALMGASLRDERLRPGAAPGPGAHSHSSRRGGRAHDGLAQGGDVDLQPRPRSRRVRLRELPLYQRPARSLGKPGRQLGGELRQAGDLGHVRRRPKPALRHGQRRGRAHVRSTSEPGGRGRLLVPDRGSLPGLALGPVAGRLREPSRLHGGPHAIHDRSRASPVGRRRRRGQPRRLLEQRPQGLAARGGRPLEAREPHPRDLLPRSGRGPGERDRHSAVGGQLRARARREVDPRADLSQVPCGPGGPAHPRGAERLQRAGVRQSLPGPARSLLRARVRRTRRMAFS